MKVNRREIIKNGLIGMTGLAMCKTESSPIKANIGSKNIILSQSNKNDEDAYYRRIYEQILSNTLPPDSELELTLTNLRPRAFANQNNLKTLTINGLLNLDASYALQDSSIESLVLPDLVSCTIFYAYGAAKLKTIVVPNLYQNMRYLCYIGSSVLTDVYISNSTCEQIMSIPNFPGAAKNQNTNYDNIVFHGSDGDVIYNGTEWVINK